MATQNLYDKDFYGWIYHNIELIRSDEWEELDKTLMLSNI